jgi:hypothetical protein
MARADDALLCGWHILRRWRIQRGSTERAARVPVLQRRQNTALTTSARREAPDGGDAILLVGYSRLRPPPPPNLPHSWGERPRPALPRWRPCFSLPSRCFASILHSALSGGTPAAAHWATPWPCCTLSRPSRLQSPSSSRSRPQCLAGHRRHVSVCCRQLRERVRRKMSLALSDSGMQHRGPPTQDNTCTHQDLECCCIAHALVRVLVQPPPWLCRVDDSRSRRGHLVSIHSRRRSRLLQHTQHMHVSHTASGHTAPRTATQTSLHTPASSSRTSVPVTSTSSMFIPILPARHSQGHRRFCHHTCLR